MIATRLQLELWGYAIGGDVLEFSATVAEGFEYLLGRCWDRTEVELAGELLDGRPVPGRFALPWCMPR